MMEKVSKWIKKNRRFFVQARELAIEASKFPRSVCRILCAGNVLVDVKSDVTEKVTKLSYLRDVLSSGGEMHEVVAARMK